MSRRCPNCGEHCWNYDKTVCLWCDQEAIRRIMEGPPKTKRKAEKEKKLVKADELYLEWKHNEGDRNTAAED